MSVDGHPAASGRYLGAMSPALRHYLLTEHVVGSAVVNFVLNGLIAWLSFRHLEVVPMLGQQSIMGDMVGTTIVLPVLTCLIVTRIVAWHLRTGKVSIPDWSSASQSFLGKLPNGAFARGLALAVPTMLLAVPLLYGLLMAAGVTSLELRPFVLFKASYSAVMAALVQPVVAMWALTRGAVGEAGASARA
jgi:hypothetical protein